MKAWICGANDDPGNVVVFAETRGKARTGEVLPDHEYLNGICPSCGAHFLDRSTKFCGNCGQALKWRK